MSTPTPTPNGPHRARVTIDGEWSPVEISSARDAVQQFREAIASAALTPPDVIEADGTLHRFASDGRRGDDSGYYLLHLDGLPAGMFGCWRSGIKHTWHAKSDRTFTADERRAHRERIDAMRRQRQADEAERQRKAAEWAGRLLHDSTPAPDGHPYLARKGIHSHGLHASGETLLVPMYIGGELVGVQMIEADGTKRFAPGGRVKSAYYPIGKPDKLLCIVEGYATGASVHEATGHAVAVAFSAGNLRAVAEALRAKFPEARIVVCADNDKSGTGQRAAFEAARAVGGLVAIPTTEGRDWNDVHKAEGLDAVRSGIEAAREPDGEPNTGADERSTGDMGLPPLGADAQDKLAENEGAENTEKKSAESQASTLVAFVRERAELVHDENGDVYAIENATGEVRNIERKAFKTWLHAEFYSETQKAARSQSVAEALTTLAGIGLHEGESVEVHIRCAALGDGYVIDLGEPGKSRAIVVRPVGWTVTEHHGVMFTRPDSMKPLPEPVGGGTLDALWSLVNVPESSRLLVTAWLLDSMRPDSPFPLLEAIGEQGSAKSGLQTLLKRLIDPSAIELRSAPRSGEDVFVGAAQGWLLAYDNVSHLSPDLQDVFCRVSTGATHATRKLYTNAEESAIRAKRPITLNGIGASITAQDLVDRSISLELATIEDRREKASIESKFDGLHPELLGALLDLFAKALAELPTVAIERDRRPRLIEFAKLGCAVAQAMGGTAETFLREFETMRAESIGRTLDASPVAGALLAYLEGRPDRFMEYTVKRLFESLDRSDGDAWPRSPKGFADALRRAAPALRSFGVLVKFLGKRGSSTWVLLTEKKSPGASRGSRASRAGEGETLPGARHHDIGDLVPASISAPTEAQEVVI